MVYFSIFSLTSELENRIGYPRECGYFSFLSGHLKTLVFPSVHWKQEIFHKDLWEVNEISKKCSVESGKSEALKNVKHHRVSMFLKNLNYSKKKLFLPLLFLGP